MAKGFIQAEETVKSENKFGNFEFTKKGDTIDFFWVDTAERVSQQYGTFEVLLGLKLNDLSSVDAAVKSAELMSLIPHTIIRNRIEDGTMVKEELYRITRAWDRGEKFADGRIAKSYGYDIKHLVLAEPDRRALIKRYRELLEGDGSMVRNETSVTESESEPSL